MTPVLDLAAVFAVACMMPVGVYYCGLFIALLAHGPFAKEGAAPGLLSWTKAWLVFCGLYAAALCLSLLSDSPHVQVMAMVAPYWLAFFGGGWGWWKKRTLYRVSFKILQICVIVVAGLARDGDSLSSQP